MYYLDSSALVKLVLEEAESLAFRRFVSSVDNAELITSALTRAELLRATLRRDGEAQEKAREVVSGVAAVTITEALLNAAGTIEPPLLRTLDAIHLATALELGNELSAFVAYDERLLESAKLVGLPVRTPR